MLVAAVADGRRHGAPAFDDEPKTILMGVFDGHGEYGDDCAGFVEENIEELLIAARSNTGLFEQPEERVRTFFREPQLAQIRSPSALASTHAASTRRHSVGVILGSMPMADLSTYD